MGLLELATEKKKKRHFCHGMTRKNTEIRAGSVSDGWRSIRISHGKTRKKAEAEELATEKGRSRRISHGMQSMGF